MLTVTKDENLSSPKNASATLRNVGETLENSKDSLREAAGKAGRKVRSFIHTAGDDLTHATDTVTTQIRSKPVQSSMIALGLGVVLGALLRR